jgi:hypothetical protein
VRDGGKECEDEMGFAFRIHIFFYGLFFFFFSSLSGENRWNEMGIRWDGMA